MISKPKPKKKKAQLKQKPQHAQKSKLTVKLLKPASKCLSVKEFHPVPKPGTRNGIRQVSSRQAERERNLQKLKHYLIAVRAKGQCEIPDCGSQYHLQGAHIIERGVGGHDNAGNILIACGDCHDHQRYAHGLPIEPEAALALVDGRNRECGISRFLTGDLVPREDVETWD